MSINIVNLKSVDIDKWLLDSRNVYIGRNVNGKGKWGNQFKLKDYNYNRQKVIALYEAHLHSDKGLLDSVASLKDKVLGCWCSPERCHGEVLHRLAGNTPVYDHHTKVPSTNMASDST